MNLPIAFTRAQALKAGVAWSTLRGPHFTRLWHDVYTAGDPDDPVIRLHAALVSAGPQSSLCGPTALAWFGVDLPDRLRLDPRLHVHTPGGHPIRLPHLRVHRDHRLLAPIVRRGLPCTPPAEAWFQLADEATTHELVVVADALMRRKRPLVTPDDLREVVDLAPARRHGRALAREALGLARPNTESVPETLTRLVVVQGGLPCPEVDYPIRNAAGQVVFRLDMAYPERRLGLEYDGAVHVGDTAQMERDQWRRRVLEDAGWRLITVTAADLRGHPHELLTSIRRAWASRT
ncbi:MAG: hypothetical protein LBR33_10730 [Propionibacteriaceae bacterium]|jgi:hypothetical protein|nr:hypothetical protein [Propionibacteriaceae bacterium]